MNKVKLLEEIQEYSKQAFLQGWAARDRDIDISKGSELAKMPEALPRINCSIKIFNQVMGTNIEL